MDQHSVQGMPGQPGRQRPVQTLARAYAEIAAHSDPWVALNEFFHEWFDYSRAERLILIAAEILPGGPSSLLDIPSSELSRPERDRRWRWAVFCAATADYLCMRGGITPPAWVRDPRYTLAEPWYYFGVRDPLTSEEQAHLEHATPALLRRRNIFCGDSVFTNKYEFARRVQQVVAARAEQPREPQ